MNHGEDTKPYSPAAGYHGSLEWLPSLVYQTFYTYFCALNMPILPTQDVPKVFSMLILAFYS